MKQQDRQKVVRVIESHTERVPLGKMLADGKSHVRVISGSKALELIEAVVDETIAKRSDLDRDRIVKEANEQFQRVAHIQAESDALVKKQQSLIDMQERRIAQLERAARKLRRGITARDRRLANSRATILNYDGEIQRLLARLEEQADWRALLAALEQRKDENHSELEQKFEAVMRDAIDRIGKTVRSATVKPIESDVEATDALVGRLFDRDHELDSNLGRLDVDVTTAKDGIRDTLARLRKLREETEIEETTT